MKKLPRDTDRNGIIIQVSEKNKKDSTKIEILQNIEEFFGAKYHREHRRWDWDGYPSIGFSSLSARITGTTKKKEIYPEYTFMTYDEIMENSEFEEFQKFSREQHSENKLFNEGLI